MINPDNKLILETNSIPTSPDLAPITAASRDHDLTPDGLTSVDNAAVIAGHILMQYPEALRPIISQHIDQHGYHPDQVDILIGESGTIFERFSAKRVASRHTKDAVITLPPDLGGKTITLPELNHTYLQPLIRLTALLENQP